MFYKYCAFLRGINVNGIKIKMDALREEFHKMNLSDVQTILATGNVIFNLPKGNCDKQELKAFIEKELSKNFNYDSHIILRDREEITNIYSEEKKITVPEEYHNYIIFCDDHELLFELKYLFDSLPHVSQEQLILSKYGLYWIVPKGFTLSSDFGSRVLGDKKYKSRLTTRNINTIEKIYMHFDKIC
jgi:uncharacterized protein (DUF1697 family)